MPNYKIVIRDWNEPRAWVAVVDEQESDVSVHHDGGRLTVEVGYRHRVIYPNLIGSQFSVNVAETHDELYEPQWIDKKDIPV